ncbi:MAG: hypothetical protein WKF91_14220 [Segetibacter sp.]
MKRILLAMSILFTAGCYAQETTSPTAVGGPEYQTALGAKISAGVAVSYKQFVANTKAIEAQSMFFSRGIRLVGLYEFHFYNIPGVDGLAWYVGPGVHVGFYRKSADLGIDGVIGLDYKIKNAPINLSLDWQPSYSLVGNGSLMPQFGGLAIRYILQ